jgi:hypothetical protein
MRKVEATLVGLVDAAQERMMADCHAARWHRDDWNWSDEVAEDCKHAAIELAHEACLLCLAGQFAQARRQTEFDDDGPLEVRWAQLVMFGTCQPWTAFREVILLAQRIDSFMSALESDQLARPLVRDCRGNLDLLCVLADWCQDNDRPRAATEARPLHDLACSYQRG